MKKEEEIRMIRAELERQARQVRTDCRVEGVLDETAKITIAALDAQVTVLDLILEKKDGGFYA